MSKNRMMRTLFIRVSQKNIIHKDNDKLGLKAGDVYIITKQDILDTIDDWLKTTKFDYYLIEHDEDPDNIHYHLVIVFKGNSLCRFSTAKNKFPYGDIDSCRNGVHRCVRYLVHADDDSKQKYEWSEIITNAPTQLEKYKLPITNSEKIIVNKLIEKICSGEIKEYEFPTKIDPKIYVKYKSAFKNAVEYYARSVLSNPNRKVNIYALIGPPGAGKSSWVKKYAEKNGKSLCLSSASNDAWQDYFGQDIFCYDDYNYEKTKIEDLLKALDPHNNTSVHARYNNKVFIGDTIFVCSNISITKWYHIEADDVLREALFRRFNYVLNFSEYDSSTGLSHYTVCKIIKNADYDRLLIDSKKYLTTPINDKKYSFNLKEYITATNNNNNNNNDDNLLSQIEDF